MIRRILQYNIEKRFQKKKAIIITGPRQVGKTTLIKNLLKNKEKALFFDGDDPLVIKHLSRPNTEQLKRIIGRNKIIFIDEAHRIPDIGITSKIIVDQFEDVQLILSGSSSFELAQRSGEPLTGRKWTFTLCPLSWLEVENHAGYIRAEQDIENRLVFGMYPDVVNNPDEQNKVLKELVDSYLYKDVLMYGNLKKPEEIQRLLQALAFQVGNEVSYNELAQIVGMDPKTIEKYIYVLEQAFVIFRLNSFSRNLRNELKKSRKIYFYDNGTLNAVTGMFQPFETRQDTGSLWENFLVSERYKMVLYKEYILNRFFWRTTQQQEVDYVEERDKKIYGFEFKLNKTTKAKIPSTFTNNYKSVNMIVTRENFRDFLTYPMDYNDQMGEFFN